MASTWLSVIIPNHNGERWLPIALQSVVDQKDGEIEVVLIDSSNDDTSMAIAARFFGVLQLRALRRPDLVSWTAKINFGVELAGGEQICILHQDDMWLPGRCTSLRKRVANAPDAVMHLHPCYIIDEAGRRLGMWRCPLPAGETPVPTPLLYERLLVQNFIGIPTPTFRRDAYLKVEGLDEALWYTADWDLYLKLAVVGNVYYHSDPLACFRVHKNSLTVLGSRDAADFREQHRIIIERHLNDLAPEKRKVVLRLFNASVEVNVALASVINGSYSGMAKAIHSVLGLGPWGIAQYFMYSRVLERVVPRIRSLALEKLAGRSYLW